MLTVVSTNPAADAKNVSPDVKIEIIFSEAINTSTFTNGMVYMKSKDGYEVSFTTAFSSDSLRLEIMPTAPLDANTAYTVYLSPTDLISGKTLASVNGDLLQINYFFDFYTMSAVASASANVPNSYTDPLYNAPLSISTLLKYKGMSADIGRVISDSNVLTLDFNGEIDVSSPQPLANVEAEMYDGTMYDPMANVSITGSHLYLSFGALQPNSRVYINVPATLKGTNGTTLTNPVDTYAYSQLSPKPFPLSRIYARLGYKSAYFDDADVYEAAMEAMLTAGAWANADLFKYTQEQMAGPLSMALVYLATGILISKKYLNSAIDQSTQLTIDITTYKHTGMQSDLGAKYVQQGIDMLRGIFPVSPAVSKHSIRVFRPRWSSKVVFDPAGVSRADHPRGVRSLAQ